MKALYGITNNNPYLIQNWLEEENIGFEIICSVEEKPSLDEDILLVTSVGTFIRFRKLLNSYKGVVVLFDIAPKCKKVKPIKLLDVDEITDDYKYKFKSLQKDEFLKRLSRALSSKRKLQVSKQTVEVIPILLSKRNDSILRPILNFQYKIPDNELREKVLMTIFKWLMKDRPVEDLRDRVLEMLGMKRSFSAFETLISFLTEDDTGIQGREALREVLIAHSQVEAKLSKAVPYDAISKKYKIDAFDLRYVVKMVKSRLTITESDKTLRELSVESKRASNS